jgi:hypothetical protein
MSHEAPNQRIERDPDEVTTKAEFTRLVEILCRDGERYPFPDIDPLTYQKLKEEEQEFPGVMTPIDVLVEKFKDEGMRFIAGTDASSGNLSIVPAISGDPVYDALQPKNLRPELITDRRVRALINAALNWQSLKD